MAEFKLALSYNDVLLTPQLSSVRSRAEIDLSTRVAADTAIKLPILSMNMDTVTGIEMAVEMDRLGGLGMMPRFDNPEVQAEKIAKIKEKNARAIGAIGIKDDYLKRSEMLIKAGAIAITLDIAHAHSTYSLSAISSFKNKFAKIPMIAGTIATYEGARDLFKAGADSVRVGIGAGTICTTRIVAGSGVPQITAISDAVRAKKKFVNKFVIADGGITNSGDIVKALALGADAVALGSLLAGTDEAPGKIIQKDGVFYKEYNASTSKKEKSRQIEKFPNGKKPHFSLHVEGVEAMVPYKGPVKNVLEELCAGVRSGFSYSGAKNIKELWKKAKFIQITPQGLRESMAHDVITR